MQKNGHIDYSIPNTNAATLLAVYDLSPPLIERRRELTMIEADATFDKIRRYAKSDGRQTKLKTELLESQLSVESAIVNYADEEDVDLIILGTKGRSGLKKILLGSVASGEVTYSTGPVLVVK